MAFMYCKLFASLYQGTLRGKSHEILVFTNMLAHADAEGCVDKHFRAIADEVGLSVDEVKVAVENLESPDPESRSPEMDGRRLLRINDHRAWGWKIVNYGKYREIKNDEDRRKANREAQARWRERQKNKASINITVTDSNQSVISSNALSAASAQEEVKGDGEAEEKESIFTLESEELPSWNPSPEMLEVASWFGRRPKTVWSKREMKEWKSIISWFEFEGDDWDALRWYYTKSGSKFLRKDIGTLLNNWQSEIDRAKNYDPEQEKRR